MEPIYDVGKIYLDKSGSGLVYLPRAIVDALDVDAKDKLKLEADLAEHKVMIKPLKHLHIIEDE